MNSGASILSKLLGSTGGAARSLSPSASRRVVANAEHYGLPRDPLSELARQSENVDSFIARSGDTYQPVLYRGHDISNPVSDNNFWSDWHGHAKEYIEGYDPGDARVSAMTYKPSDVMFYREGEMQDMLDAYRGMSKKELSDMYTPIIEEGRLDDAIFQADLGGDNYRDNTVNLLKELLSDNSQYFGARDSKINTDLLMPLMQRYGMEHNKPIVGFTGHDFYGSDEYVVSDISKMQSLDDIFAQRNTPQYDFQAIAKRLGL